MADKKISELTAGTPINTDIIPYVDLVTGETKKALKSELDGADGNTILNGTSDPTTEGVDGDFYINTASSTIFGPKATTWPAGVALIGAVGNGISGIALVSTLGLVDTYRITYTDATTFDYTVTNGADGTGDVSKVGTPADNQIGVWTGDGTIEGDTNLTYDGTTLTSSGKTILGDPGTEGTGINVNGTTYESTAKVSDIDGTHLAQTILHRHSTTLEPLILGARSNSNTSSHADVTNGQGLYSTYAAGWAGSNYKLFGQAQFAADSTGTISDTSAPGKYEIKVTPDGSVTPATALTIANDKSATFAGVVSATNLSGTNTGNETTTTVGTLINSATAKTTPVDADMLGLMDSAASNVLKKLSWANVKATLNTVYDALGAAATAETNAKSYADGLVVGLWDDRGSFDASVNAYPSTGGSGTAGAILKGDTWTVSVAGTLPTAQVVEIGDIVRALTDTPGNTQVNWAIQQNNIGYTAENSANKSTTLDTDKTSDTKYPSVKSVYDWAVGLFATKIAPTFTGIVTNTTGPINQFNGANIASATTTDIGAATGNSPHITGNNTITSLGTIQAGVQRIPTFDGILTLTHNATSLILPTGANITTAAGDTATFISEGSGNWRCTNYQRKDGTALASGASGGFTSKVSAYQASGTVGNTFATIPFSTENYDIDSEFASGVFTAAVTGYYHVDVQMGVASANNKMYIRPYLNTSTYLGEFENLTPSVAGGDQSVRGSFDIYLTSGQTLHFEGRHQATTKNYRTGKLDTNLSIHRFG